MNVWRHWLHGIFNLLKLCSKTKYFPELKEKEVALVRNQSSIALDVSDIFDKLPDQFYDLKNDLSARDVFQEMALSQFWCALRESYQQYGVP